MKAHTASLINAILLVALSSWGYFDSETPSFTALIPAFIGVVLLICNPGVKKENKVIAHIAVLLTLVVGIGLFRPLMGVIDRSNILGIFRVSVMLISTVIAMVFFVKSFIDARRNRQATWLLLPLKKEINQQGVCGCNVFPKICSTSWSAPDHAVCQVFFKQKDWITKYQAYITNWHRVQMS